MVSSFIATVISVFGLTFVAMVGVSVGLWITRDYKKRVVCWEKFDQLEAEALSVEFERRMWILSAYVTKRLRPIVPPRVAERALLEATVLREHIEVKSGRRNKLTYLRSRRELLGVAKRMNYSKHFCSARVLGKSGKPKND